tara:strand:+ start:425 stop:616 length:192 start_codon:yes stop_codon:yes gene_type:complete
LSIANSKSPNSIFRRKADGKVVVQKDDAVISVYDNERKLVETHLKGLELRERQRKQDDSLLQK